MKYLSCTYVIWEDFRLEFEAWEESCRSSSSWYARWVVVFEFEIWEEKCRSWVWGMRGELSLFILRYERRAVVRRVWSIPYELWFFKFEVCHMSCRSSSLRNVSWLSFVTNFVLTIGDNWVFDIKQWNNIVINTTGFIYAAGTAYPARALEFTPSFSCVRA
jgi:hypothetical protein